MGACHIRIGDDATEYGQSNPTIVENIADGGLFEATSLLSGRYLTLRRNTVYNGIQKWSTVH